MFRVKVFLILLGFFPETFSTNSSVFRSFVYELKTCFSSKDLLNCAKNETMYMLDNAFKDNREWKLNDMISIKSNDNSLFKNSLDKKSSLSEKIHNILESRHVEIKFSNQNNEEARKKKNGKHSGMMMLGGMAMVGMLAQLILGKITALAAAALILAKIALVFSTLNGLKKSSSTQGEVYVDPHGGYGNGAWQRSIAENN